MLSSSNLVRNEAEAHLRSQAKCQQTSYINSFKTAHGLQPNCLAHKLSLLSVVFLRSYQPQGQDYKDKNITVE